MLLNALKSKAVFKVGAFGGDSDHLGVYPRWWLLLCHLLQPCNLAFVVGETGLFLLCST